MRLTVVLAAPPEPEQVIYSPVILLQPGARHQASRAGFASRALGRPCLILIPLDQGFKRNDKEQRLCQETMRVQSALNIEMNILDNRSPFYVQAKRVVTCNGGVAA